MKSAVLTLLAMTALLLVPSPASAATCSDHSTQTEAQQAADTVDGDSDGIYCESLPCPCSQPGSGTSPPPPPPPATQRKPSCSRPASVQRLRFCAAKYPNIKKHTKAAIANGWPRVMVLNRPRNGDRRERLLENIPTMAGFDRDEYPAAVGRGRANGSQRGLVRAQPDGLDRRRGLLAEQREPLARGVAGQQAAAILRRHALSLRVQLSAS